MSIVDNTATEQPRQTDEPTISKLDSALAYAKQGLAVFPVYGIDPSTLKCLCGGKPACAGGDNAGKHPITASGVSEATTNTAKIRNWWTSYPEANIGVATGEVIVLDVDGPNGRASLNGTDFPDGFRVTTGRVDSGTHHYFKAPTFPVKNSIGKLGEGLDIRATGGYVLGAGSRHKSGAIYQATGDLADIPELPESLGKLIQEAAKRPVDVPTGKKMTAGGRNTYLASVAGGMRRRQASKAELLAALTVRNAERCEPPLPHEEVEKIAESYSGMAATDDLLTAPDTDAGNAERLYRLHGDRIRYCYQEKSFYSYDGKQWKPDNNGEIERLALDTVRVFGIAAFNIQANTADEVVRRRDRIDFALKSESSQRQAAMIAAVRKLVPVQPEEFDADPYLLNTQSGTINLRTGTLLDHSPADMLRKITGAAYQEDANLAEWDNFLSHVTNHGAELAEFLQTAVGYSLTGSTKEEKLFFIHGPENAGKSTFIEAIKATLGDYAATADFETFLKRHHVGGPREDVARLEGARLVTSVEVDEGKRLAEGLVKTITGGDEITARELYKQAREFHPQFKLWLVANHAPKVNQDDGAMWRRILRIPMENQVTDEQRDTNLKVRLSDPQYAGAAILSWAVCGCQRWIHAGKLHIPELVTRATEQYRADQDEIELFIADECEVNPEAETESGALHKAYEQWCRSQRTKPMGKKPFGEKLDAKGYQASRGTGGVRLRSGLALASDWERPGRT